MHGRAHPAPTPFVLSGKQLITLRSLSRRAIHAIAACQVDTSATTASIVNFGLIAGTVESRFVVFHYSLPRIYLRVLCRRLRKRSK